MTGTWFIKSKPFADWKTNPYSFLWIHGIPGCGKTILCSTITEDVVHHCSLNPNFAVVYFYFDFNDVERQFHENMIRSLVTQLSIQSQSIPRALESLFVSKMDGQQQPMAGELLTTLRQMVCELDETFIILDGLDECRDRQQLLATIEEIVGWKCKGLHILVTSRREKDIEEWLKPLINNENKIPLQGAQVNNDIRSYIHKRLQTDWWLKKWQMQSMDIETMLMGKVDGM
jgi:hypothetical protein